MWLIGDFFLKGQFGKEKGQIVDFRRKFEEGRMVELGGGKRDGWGMWWEGGKDK